jgi:Domain of unknown function (DUF1937)
MTAKKRARKIIYLACPYTHASSKIRKQRFLAATAAAAHLIKKGHIVFSPVTMTHPIDSMLAGKRGTLGSDFWLSFDELFMEICSELVILPVKGWQTSEGIAREREFFRKKGRPIRVFNLRVLQRGPISFQPKTLKSLSLKRVGKPLVSPSHR